MNEEVKDFIMLKLSNKLWHMEYRQENEEPKWNDKTTFFACINPKNHKIEKIYDSYQEIGYDLNVKSIQPKLSRYWNDKFKKTEDPTIKEYIIVNFKLKDTKKSFIKFKEIIEQKAIDKVIQMQAGMIRDSLKSKHYIVKKAIFSTLKLINNPKTLRKKYEIILE